MSPWVGILVLGQWRRPEGFWFWSPWTPSAAVAAGISSMPHSQVIQLGHCSSHAGARGRSSGRQQWTVMNEAVVASAAGAGSE